MQPGNDEQGFYNAADYFVDRNVREGRGGKTAVICEGRQLTYGEIQAGVNRFGNLLKSLDVRLEERVALLLLDTEVFPQAFFGAIKTGAVPVCLNTLMRAKDYRYFLNDSRARVLVIDAALKAEFDAIEGPLPFLEHVVVANGAAEAGEIALDEAMACQPDILETAPTTRDDACFWLYSSGTTGQPKGTVHLQHDMVVAAETFGQQILNIQEDDICFSAAKLFFAYGLGNGLYFPFSVGATAVYHPGRPAPDAVYEVIERHNPTLFFGVPTLYAQMLEHKTGKLNGVRLGVSAGESLPADIFRRWRERFGVEIVDGIGSTEMTHIFITNRPGECRPGSTGRTVPGYDARIVDEQMNDLPCGEVGTLLVKGDSAAACYWNKHEKTKTTMLGEWHNTGDKFYRDEDGYFYYAGRSDDMLKISGIWVSPIEVEGCIIAHPAVLECAVVPCTDSDGLVKPKAYVVLSGNWPASPELEQAIKDHVKSSLAPYKYPRWVSFVDTLPKTPTGKIKRFELKRRSLEAAAEEIPLPPAESRRAVQASPASP
ncbi:benzoate-CoA ligase family protein [Motiliproteus sp. SC1-56]|uniref:benzoate-CoA ligase family protein n=1 Tax=Motiliproteus sp. SC1-56 TaxID=2799565 RepID=UPI001A8C509C|nr:benzoate-CoA ligase family protein [Motiliproteus sp. SC1-56]